MKHVVATCRNDTSQLQIALRVLDNFYENLCLYNRILSLQKVAHIQSNYVLCNLLRRQRLLQKFSCTRKVICHFNVSLQHVLVTHHATCT